MHISSATDVGRVREVNEDSFLVDEELELFVVCDGMGGHAAGEVASRTVVQTVQEAIDMVHGSELELLTEALRESVEEANRRVHRLGQEARERNGMGTTCTALLLRGTTGIIAHVGDSRLYLQREGRLHQLTHDHTFVAEAIRSGLVKKGDPSLVEHSNLVTRAVGPLPEVLVDVLSFDVLPNDTILLCSDGLYEYFEDEEELGERLASPSIAAIAPDLVHDANERGGHDNITALVLRVDASQKSKAVGRITATFSALSHIGLFSELTLPELTTVTRQLSFEDYSEGEVIFRQNDVSESLYIVVHGEVYVQRDGERIAELPAGAHFGEMALLNQRPRSATVVAAKDTSLLRLTRDAFYQVVQQDHVVGVKFLWKLAQTLSLRLEDTFDTPEEIDTARKTLAFGLFPSPFKE